MVSKYLVRQTQADKARIIGQIAAAEAEIDILRRKAIQAGLSGDFRANGKYTSRIQKLVDNIWRLNCQLDPSINN